MQKQIKISLAAILFFICSLADAQTGRFVELTVSDTFGLNPISYVYEISAGDPMDFMQYTGEEEGYIQKKGDDLKAQAQLKDVTNMLDREKFSYTKPESFSYSKYAPSSSVLVTVSGDKELKRLHELVKEMKDVTGKVKDVNYEAFSGRYQQVDKRLFDMAKKRALEMALMSGASLGGLISVTDVKSTDGFNMYADMIRKAASGYGYGNEPFSRKIEEVSMIFRFELK